MRMQMAAFAIFSGIAIGEPLVTGPIVVLLGPPGSGKTTQAAAVAKYLGVPIVSVAELIKDNAAEYRKPGPEELRAWSRRQILC